MMKALTNFGGIFLFVYCELTAKFAIVDSKMFKQCI